MPLPDMTAEQFLTAATTVAAQFPGCRLRKNQVGNLAIITVDGDGREWYVGSVNLRTGEVDSFTDEPWPLSDPPAE